MTTSDLELEVTALRDELLATVKQQAASQTILRAIAASRTDMQSVLETITESAARLCQAYDSVILLKNGDSLNVRAHHGPIPANNLSIPIDYSWVNGRAFMDRRPVQVADLQMAEDYPGGRESALRQGHRTILAVPLLRDEEAIGTLTVRRREVQLFSDKQIELLSSFADQAVIAIENVRLSVEAQQRNQELAATSEVLGVIARSPADPHPVFQVIAESAARLCNADDACVQRFDGTHVYLEAVYGLTPQATQATRLQFPRLPSRGFIGGRSILSGNVEAIPEYQADPDYDFKVEAQVANTRSAIAVPMLKDGRPIGAIVLDRSKPGYFPERQVKLLKTFATQAVIALENVRLFEEVRTRNSELSASLDAERATSSILQVIATSPTDTQPVLDAIVESAARLCDAYDALIFLREGETLSCRAHYGGIPMDFTSRPISRNWVTGQAFLDQKPVHVHDVSAAAGEFPLGQTDSSRFGDRTLLAVPLLGEGDAIGVIVIRRREVRPFTDKQIELLSVFANQAVIAITNSQLIQEIVQRSRELEVTGDVLQVIAQSPSETQPVYDAIARGAAMLCNAQYSFVYRYDGVLLHFVAHHGLPPDAERSLVKAFPMLPGRASAGARAVLSRRVEQIPDIEEDLDYVLHAEANLTVSRSVIGIPMLRNGQPIGAIAVDRSVPGQFPERHVELLKAFADQAVIAVENARLFGELSQRNQDLSEALEQQTATSTILRAITSSPIDVQPVLDSVSESAAKLCGANDAIILLLNQDGLVLKSHYGDLPKDNHDTVLPVNRQWVTGRAVIDREPIHVLDILSAVDEFPEGRELALRFGHRTTLAVPLLREGLALGAILIRRMEVKAFDDRQIHMLKSFADQAVIAIENVRLFKEVQARTEELSEALQQQTATADVLKVISRSAFNLQTVLDALLESAAKLCHAEMADMLFRTDDGFRYVSMYGYTPEQKEFITALPFTPGRGSAVGRVAEECRAVSIEDVLSDPEYTLLDAQKSNGFRSLLAVPLMSEGELQGIMVLQRKTVSPFSNRHIELVSTFADQAVIAVKNVRLFEEVQERTQELSRSLEELKTAQDRLIQTEKLASLGQLTAGIAHEIKNPLNFVNNFAALSVELIDEIGEVLKPDSLDERQRETLEELMATLTSNLGKITEHGKRADSIVRNMLLHSRQSGGERRQVSLNRLIEESLNLAYHGARAERPDFNITFEKDLDAEAGEVDLFPQEITRVFLNLLSNGFYATTRRKAEMVDASYEPTLSVSTRGFSDRVEIRIRDNGTGIPAAVQDKIFNPFFTTKPAGEGTGLGLSLSHDIVVKQHNGSIDVNTELGQYTEFIIRLPRSRTTTSGEIA